MLTPFDGELLEWMMGHGLAYIGKMPEGWEPKPENWAARKFYWRYMWWRKYV